MGGGGGHAPVYLQIHVKPGNMPALMFSSLPMAGRCQSGEAEMSSEGIKQEGEESVWD